MVIKKFNRLELPKKFIKVGVDVKSILLCMASLVSEILLLSKMAKFPFLTMDYDHGHQFCILLSNTCI